MGQARLKRKSHAQILQTHPYCIYCGGTEDATTIDHMPARAMFEGRQRPKGLEFPACYACNEGGRIDELIAATLSRAYPDPETEGAKKEVRKLWDSINNNCPGLLGEINPSFRQEKLARGLIDDFSSSGFALNARGPILNRAIHRFAAKIGYALHFELTGKSVPPGGVAYVWQYSNYQALKGEIPNELMNILGAPQTLRQGRWEVSNQFTFASNAIEGGAMSVHFAAFRFSFAVCAAVAENSGSLRPPENIRHVVSCSPGWLKI
jgi:hypothetical protein